MYVCCSTDVDLCSMWSVDCVYNNIILDRWACFIIIIIIIRKNNNDTVRLGYICGIIACDITMIVYIGTNIEHTSQVTNNNIIINKPRTSHRPSHCEF